MRRSRGSQECYYVSADTGLEFLLGILGLNPLSFTDNSAPESGGVKLNNHHFSQRSFPSYCDAILPGQSASGIVLLGNLKDGGSNV